MQEGDTGDEMYVHLGIKVKHRTYGTDMCVIGPLWGAMESWKSLTFNSDFVM